MTVRASALDAEAARVVVLREAQDPGAALTRSLHAGAGFALTDDPDAAPTEAVDAGTGEGAAFDAGTAGGLAHNTGPTGAMALDAHAEGTDALNANTVCGLALSHTQDACAAVAVAEDGDGGVAGGFTRWRRSCLWP